MGERDGKTWRKSAKQMEYEILCVSQFTLYGSIENKNVPDFKLSMKNEAARGVRLSRRWWWQSMEMAKS